MLDENQFAFKEWAAVCAALECGQQCVILRKGGIQERGGRFAVEHDEFWLYPTRFHQNADELRSEAQSLLDTLQPPAAGVVTLRFYAVVEEAVRIDDRDTLVRIAPLQVFADDTLRMRFEYREPGLFALLVRMYRAVDSINIPELPAFAGCRTWVDLGESLSTSGLSPVLDDATHKARISLLRASLGERGA